MMLNKAQIIGHLGRDPEVRYLPNGDAVANITVATTEKWKNQAGEPMEHTEWHRVTLFKRMAEIAGEYLKRGSLVFIEGKIQSRKYTDKDGAEKVSVEIRADDMKMLGGKPDFGGQQRQEAPAQRAPAAAPRQAPAPRPVSGFDDMDDIPF